MTTRPTRLAAVALVVAGFLSLTPRASADFVDTFDLPNPQAYYQIALLNGNPYNSPALVVSPDVTRAIQVMAVPPLDPDNSNNAVSGYIGQGRFSLAADGNTAATAKVTYMLSGTAGNLTGLTTVELDFRKLDAGTGASTTPVTVSITSGGVTQSFTKSVAESNMSFTESFAVGSLTGNVESITVTLNSGSPAQTAVDFTLDAIRVKTVPAPPALLLAGFGVLALVGRARFTRAK